MSNSIFPDGVDSFNDPSASTLMNDPIYDHAHAHSLLNDAVFNIEKLFATPNYGPNVGQALVWNGNSWAPGSTIPSGGGGGGGGAGGVEVVVAQSSPADLNSMSTWELPLPIYSGTFTPLSTSGLIKAYTHAGVWGNAGVVFTLTLTNNVSNVSTSYTVDSIAPETTETIATVVPVQGLVPHQQYTATLNWQLNTLAYALIYDYPGTVIQNSFLYVDAQSPATARLLFGTTAGISMASIGAQPGWKTPGNMFDANGNPMTAEPVEYNSTLALGHTPGKLIFNNNQHGSVAIPNQPFTDGYVFWVASINSDNTVSVFELNDAATYDGIGFQPLVLKGSTAAITGITDGYWYDANTLWVTSGHTLTPIAMGSGSPVVGTPVTVNASDTITHVYFDNIGNGVAVSATTLYSLTNVTATNFTVAGSHIFTNITGLNAGINVYWIIEGTTIHSVTVSGATITVVNTFNYAGQHVSGNTINSIVSVLTPQGLTYNEGVIWLVVSTVTNSNFLVVPFYYATGAFVPGFYPGIGTTTMLGFAMGNRGDFYMINSFSQIFLWPGALAWSGGFDPEVASPTWRNNWDYELSETSATPIGNWATGNTSLDPGYHNTIITYYENEGSGGSIFAPGLIGETTVDSLSAPANGDVALGYQALGLKTPGATTSDSGSLQDVAIGFQALARDAGGANVAVGSHALLANTGGYSNTAIGHESMLNNTTGVNNVGVGIYTLINVVTGSNNTAVGAGALNGTVGSSASFNVAIGFAAAGAASGSRSVAIGWESAYNDQVGSQTAVGYQAMSYVDSNPTTRAGAGQVAVGYNSMFQAILSQADVAVGHQTLMHDEGGFNTAIGYDSMVANTTGFENTALGYQSLNVSTTGYHNVALGAYALLANTTGADNVAIGRDAGAGIVAGNSNIAIGTSTISSHDTSGNIAIGNSALGSASASTNIAIGIQALQTDTGSAGYNIGIGHQVMVNAQPATPNIGIGYQALQSDIYGANVAVGYQSMYTAKPTFFPDIAIGFQSLMHDQSGANIAIGYQALMAGLNPSHNTVIGHQAMQNTSGTHDEIAIGYQSLQVDQGNQNIAIGNYTLNSNTTGLGNVAIGFAALIANTTGGYNIALGPSVLHANSIGSNNTAVGYLALNNTNSSNNTGIGFQSILENTTGAGNVGVGVSALQQNSNGSNNVALGFGTMLNANSNSDVAVGYQALYNDSGAIVFDISGGNIAIGYQALYSDATPSYSIAIGWSSQSSTNNSYMNIGLGAQTLEFTTGAQNVAIGHRASQFNTSGTDNVAIGYNALLHNTTGGNNTALGATALYQALTSNNTAIGTLALYRATLGTDNTAVGYSAGQYTTVGNFNTALGENAGPPTGYDPSYSLALGYNTAPRANGSVAIGTDHTGAGAAAATPDYIVLGTSNHTIRMNTPTATSATSGTAAFLPATPAGYFPINFGGTNYKIPFYAV